MILNKRSPSCFQIFFIFILNYEGNMSIYIVCFNQERKKKAKPKIIGGRKILTISAGTALANTDISPS